MSFKRLESEDIVLSSELITFPTWYTQEGGDTSHLDMEDAVECPEQGFSVDYYTDYYSKYTPPQCEDCDDCGEESKKELEIEEEGGFDLEHSKALFSLAYATRPENRIVDFKTGDEEPVEGEEEVPGAVAPAEIIFGQYRSLVLGDEDSDFRFGNTKIGSSDSDSAAFADSFIAMSIDRSRFREKLDPSTCRIRLSDGRVLAPDTSANRRYLDAGRVFDLAVRQEREVDGKTAVSYVYPTDEVSAATSYGYFLPDIGVILFNTSNNAALFDRATSGSGYETASWGPDPEKVKTFKEEILTHIDLRSQETITSNFVFIRARNAEFNYSTNPSNITGSAGNIRHDVMINQPQSFITTVGLYNDANDLLAVAKLSRPLIKDFTKEALIRIKLDY